MKKSVIYTTAILLVVTALCLTAVTFSFFTTKSSNIEIDIDSLTTTSFSFDSPTLSTKNIYGDNPSTIGEIISVGDDYAYCTIDYSTQEDYANMYFTVERFRVLDKNGNPIERIEKDADGNRYHYNGEERVEGGIDNESNYMGKHMKYMFVKQIQTGTNSTDVGISEADEKALLVDANWKSEAKFKEADKWDPELDKKYFNLGQLNGKTKMETGTIRLYLKLGNNLDNELVPGNLKDCKLQVQIRAQQI